MEGFGPSSLDESATSYEMYLQATDILLADGPVVMIKYERAANPAQNIATKNYAQVMKIMTEYGLTIKSRGNIKEMKSDKEEESPLDRFIKRLREKRDERLLSICC